MVGWLVGWLDGWLVGWLVGGRVVSVARVNEESEGGMESERNG